MINRYLIYEYTSYQDSLIVNYSCADIFFFRKKKLFSQLTTLTVIVKKIVNNKIIIILKRSFLAYLSV